MPHIGEGLESQHNEWLFCFLQVACPLHSSHLENPIKLPCRLLFSIHMKLHKNRDVFNPYKFTIIMSSAGDLAHRIRPNPNFARGRRKINQLAACQTGKRKWIQSATLAYLFKSVFHIKRNYQCRYLPYTLYRFSPFSLAQHLWVPDSAGIGPYRSVLLEDTASFSSGLPKCNCSINGINPLRSRLCYNWRIKGNFKVVASVI